MPRSFLLISFGTLTRPQPPIVAHFGCRTSCASNRKTDGPTRSLLSRIILFILTNLFLKFSGKTLGALASWRRAVWGVVVSSVATDDRTLGAQTDWEGRTSTHSKCPGPTIFEARLKSIVAGEADRAAWRRTHEDRYHRRRQYRYSINAPLSSSWSRRCHREFSRTGVAPRPCFGNGRTRSDRPGRGARPRPRDHHDS